jgi:hypothetical protein
MIPSSHATRRRGCKEKRARGEEDGHEKGPRSSQCHSRGCFQRGASQRPRPPEAPAAAGAAAGATAAPTSATAAGTGTTAGTRAGEAAAGGMAAAASDLDAAARSAASATGGAAAAGARVGNGGRHAPPAVPVRPQGAGAARQGERPRNLRRLRGCSCAALPIPVHPLCSASQLARIAYGSAEPAVDARRDDPRGSGILRVYCIVIYFFLFFFAKVVY